MVVQTSTEAVNTLVPLLGCMQGRVGGSSLALRSSKRVEFLKGWRVLIDGTNVGPVPKGVTMLLANLMINYSRFSGTHYKKRKGGWNLKVYSRSCVYRYCLVTSKVLADMLPRTYPKLLRWPLT